VAGIGKDPPKESYVLVSDILCDSFLVFSLSCWERELPGTNR
jgi:hypothetical protein